VNRRQRERIIEELRAEAGMLVWEIGPGIGSMTELALASGLRVVAFEIDYGFSRLLKRVYGGNPGFKVVEGDFIDTWRAELEASGQPERIFGNLPYNAANAIVASLIEGGLIPPRMVFTVQKEAGLRMTAVPGSKDYSAFSVLCTSACRSKLAFDLGSSSFWPVPRVTSSVVRMERRQDPVAAEDRRGFSAFVRSGFSSRRKTLRNNIRALSPEVDAALGLALDELGIRPDIRAEALRPEQLAALYSRLKGRSA
jgi:Dimethyladenosine transferase (rRNA methylation)